MICGRQRKKRATIAAAIICGVAPVLLLGCGGESGKPHAGQIVVPHVYGTGGVGPSSRPTTISLYEYSDTTRYIITGKSITFRLPENYTEFSTNRASTGGPQYMIEIVYHGDTKRPYDRMIYPDASTGAIALTLKTHDFVAPVTEDAIKNEKARLITPGFFGIRRLERVKPDHCGFHAYKPVSEPPNSFRIQNTTPRDSSWPYATAIVLAEPAASGLFDPALTCEYRAGHDGFPLCRIVTSYRGWPLEIHLSGHSVCESAQISKEARMFLDRYRIGETERSPGQIESRN